MSRSASLRKSTTRSGSQRKSRKSGSQRKTRKSTRESKKLNRNSGRRSSIKMSRIDDDARLLNVGETNEITKFNADLNVAKLFTKRGEQVTSFVDTYKDVNDELQIILDKAARSQGKKMENNYIIDGVISNGKIKKSISSTFMLFSRHRDYSRMFSRYIFDMVSVIMFYEIPNDVELELIEYTKVKLRKKKYGLFSMNDYVEIGRHKIEKDKFYIVPDYHYYKIVSKEQYKKEKVVKYIWLCVQVGRKHKGK